jgi:hypothetical protein
MEYAYLSPELSHSASTLRTILDRRRALPYGVGVLLAIGGQTMLRLNESQAKEFIAELAAKCHKRWKETVDKTRFMDELKEGKLKKETIQLFYKNWGSFVPVINSVYTSAFTSISGSL